MSDLFSFWSNGVFAVLLRSRTLTRCWCGSLGSFVVWGSSVVVGRFAVTVVERSAGDFAADAGGLLSVHPWPIRTAFEQEKFHWSFLVNAAPSLDGARDKELAFTWFHALSLRGHNAQKLGSQHDSLEGLDLTRNFIYACRSAPVGIKLTFDRTLFHQTSHLWFGQKSRRAEIPRGIPARRLTR